MIYKNADMEVGNNFLKIPAPKKERIYQLPGNVQFHIESIYLESLEFNTFTFSYVGRVPFIFHSFGFNHAIKYDDDPTYYVPFKFTLHSLVSFKFEVEGDLMVPGLLMIGEAVYKD